MAIQMRCGWRTRRTGNHSPGQNSWWWTWQVGRQIEGFHADRGLFQGAILGLIWLKFLSLVSIPKTLASIKRIAESTTDAGEQAPS